MMNDGLRGGAGWRMDGMGPIALRVVVFPIAGIVHLVRGSRGR